MLISPTSYFVIIFIFFLELMYLEIKQVKQKHSLLVHNIYIYDQCHFTREVESAH